MSHWVTHISTRS